MIKKDSKKEIIFFATGHENILGNHKNTIEFTKDDFLTLQGDCIIGINANFNYDEIKKILIWDKAKIEITIDDKIEEIEGIINKKFSNKHEIVIRKSDFISDRTLLTRCDKGAKDLSRDFVNLLKNKNIKIKVKISRIKSSLKNNNIFKG